MAKTCATLFENHERVRKLFKNGGQMLRNIGKKLAEPKLVPPNQQAKFYDARSAEIPTRVLHNTPSKL